MSTDTTIEWTDKTWNPVRGCSVISPGCVNCYAMKQAHRFSGDGKPFAGMTKQTKAGPQWTGVVRTIEDALLEPLSWREKREACVPCMSIDGNPCAACGGRGYHTRGLRVFVNSMSDLFHEDVPDYFIARVFSVMAWARQHTFQILTKRAQRMRALLSSPEFRSEVGEFVDFWLHEDPEPHRAFRWDPNERRTDDARARQPDVEGDDWPLPNVWLGVSVEDQPRADERIPLLLQTPAAVRFISAEPLLGPVDLSEIRVGGTGQEWDPYLTADALNRPLVFGPHLDWVIVGGESGNGARPFDLAWARSIVAQCKAAGVACFMKQTGSVVRVPRADALQFAMRGKWRAESPGSDYGIAKPHHHKGGDMSEWPEDLRVREFPEVRA